MLKLEDLKSKQESFRPLPGDLISQFENWCGGTGFMRFRPLPGDLISQFHYTKQFQKDEHKSFRPLPGDLISQLI